MSNEAMQLQRLRQERAEAVTQVAALRTAFDDIVSSCQHVSNDDEHDPEGATVAFERAQVAALRDAAEQHLADLDLALERIESGEPATCEVCGDEIGAERQDALPATRRCVRCAG